MFYINGLKVQKEIDKIESSGILSKKYRTKHEIEYICKLKGIDYNNLIIVDDTSRKRIPKG